MIIQDNLSVGFQLSIAQSCQAQHEADPNEKRKLYSDQFMTAELRECAAHHIGISRHRPALERHR